MAAKIAYFSCALACYEFSSEIKVSLSAGAPSLLLVLLGQLADAAHASPCAHGTTSRLPTIPAAPAGFEYQNEQLQRLLPAILLL